MHLNSEHKKTSKVKKYLLALKQYYLEPLEKTFKKFRNGVIYFSVGLITFYLASTNIKPSALQELVVLGALCLSITGFTIAMLAQTRMIISRIVKFFTVKN